MHRIPPGNPSSRFSTLPEGPSTLAATFWGGNASADAIRRRLQSWMMTVKGPIATVGPALEAIAWAQGLPQLETLCDATGWQELCAVLCRMTTEIDAAELPTRPLLHQLLAGELALTLAARLPGAKESRRLAKSGRAAVTLGLNVILDSQGVPASEHFHQTRPLLDCWTRCRALRNDVAEGMWGPRAQQRFDRFVRHVLRTARPDGRPPLAGDGAASDDRALFQAALAASDDRALFQAALAATADAVNRPLAAIALPRPQAAVSRAARKAVAAVPASLHSEENALAVLRRGWDRDDERLLVRFAGPDCQIELVASGRVVFSGAWRIAVSRGGRPLAVASEWESVCWHSDTDVDYLELQIELRENVTLQRHLLLAREDRFLLLADAVLGAGDGGIDYCGTLPLATGTSFHPAAESREGLLAASKVQKVRSADRPNGRPLAQVLPLALPEWRTDTRGGELAMASDGLTLRQTTGGPRLFAPLFFDLDRARFRRRLTWRTLTVAESLTPVPADRAVGYRVAIGKEQWLFYRSLAAQGNRTLLGHNLSTETLVARFDAEGEVAALIEIE